MLPSCSQTTGWPVQPFPHHVAVVPRSVEWEHIGASGNFHLLAGVAGIGPDPYQVLVGFPRNMSTPCTSSDPQRCPTVLRSTQVLIGSVVVVVVVVSSAVVAVVVPAPASGGVV